MMKQKQVKKDCIATSVAHLMDERKAM